MFQINVQADISRALDKLVYVRKEIEDKATTRAINKVAALAKTQASREIRTAGYSIKMAEIKKALDLLKAGGGRKSARLRAMGRPLNMIHFDARPVKNGVTVSVKNGRKLIRHAFIATVKGKTGVFERTDGKGFRVGYEKNGKRNNMQLPIKGVYGPSIPTAFINDAVQGALVDLVRARFPDIFAHEIEYLRLK